MTVFQVHKAALLWIRGKNTFEMVEEFRRHGDHSITQAKLDAKMDRIRAEARKLSERAA